MRVSLSPMADARAKDAGGLAHVAPLALLCAGLLACGGPTAPSADGGSVPPSDAGSVLADAGAYDGAWGVPYDAGPDSGVAPEASEPTVLAAGLGSPAGIVVSGGTVYAADSATGEIVAIPAGGEARVLASGLGDPRWLATDGTTLFATDAAGGRLLAVALDGGVSVLAPGQDQPGRVVVSAGTVFWIDQGSENGTGRVMSIPAPGGDPTTLASGLQTPHDLAVIGSSVYFTELGPPPNCSTGQWAGGARIASVPVDGGSPQSVYASETAEVGRVVGLASDGSGRRLALTTQDLCWPKGGWVYLLDLQTRQTTPLSQAPPNSDRVDADSEDVVWASQQLISEVPVAGGPYVNLVSESAVFDFVFQGGVLYWTDPVAGEVLSKEP